MAKKNPTKDLDDVRFIAQAVVRFLRMSTNELMAHMRVHKMDAFASVPHSTRRQCFCGREASDRFWAMARRFLDADPNRRGRIDEERFVGDLKAAFSACFLEPPAEPTEVGVLAMLEQARQAAEARFVGLTHYIPCAIFLSKAERRFSVGPVEFVHEAEFWIRNDAEIQAFRVSLANRYAAERTTFPGLAPMTPERAKDLADRQVDEIAGFFRQFNWIAVVKVEPCDESVSYNHALYLTKRALDVIKLFLGDYYTGRLRTADDRGHARKSAKLTRRGDNSLDWSLASTPNDNVVGDNWLKALTQNEQFELAAKALSLVAQRTDAPLCVRFIDALAWYGDAISEQQAGAKIVKFVTAIERIAGTGKDDARGINQIIKSRAGLFYHHYSGKPLEEAIATVQSVYGLRSGLVHGSVSPFDPMLRRNLHEVGSVTQVVVIAALDFFTSLGLDRPDFDNDALRRAFLRLEAAYPVLAKAHDLDRLFDSFIRVLGMSVKQIHGTYFNVPIAGRADPIYRERAFCYELYHQLRLNIPQDSRFAYWLTGELDKNGHPLIESQVAPDLVLHEPGNMNQNFCVIEVKPIMGKLAGFRKDIRTLTEFTMRYGYHVGMLLIFGDGPSAPRRIKRLSEYFGELRRSRISVVWVKARETKVEILN